MLPGALGTCPDPLPEDPFPERFAALVDGVRNSPGLPVPPPLYGRWHAAEGTLGGTAKAWLRWRCGQRSRARAEKDARSNPAPFHAVANAAPL
jgi:hypothetical protein